MTETFTADELDGAKFRINVTQATCDAGADYPIVSIFVKRASQANYGEFDSYQFDSDFNCNNQNGAYMIEEDFAAIFENTVPEALGFNSPVYDTMVARNIIATPIQTLEKNNGLTIRGSRTLFNFFDKNTGGADNLNNSSVYPNSFYQYEMTFDENNAVVLGSNNGWVLDGTISKYDPVWSSE